MGSCPRGRAGSSNFGHALEAVTPGAASGGAGRAPRRGVGRARRRRRHRAGRVGAGTVEGEGGREAGLPPSPLSGEAPRTAARVRRTGVRKSGGTRVARPAGAREAGGGAGHTWRRSRAMCGVPGLAGGGSMESACEVPGALAEPPEESSAGRCAGASAARSSPRPRPCPGASLASRAPPKACPLGGGMVCAAPTASWCSWGWQIPSFASGHCSLVGFCHAGVLNVSPVEFAALAFYGTQSLHYFWGYTSFLMIPRGPLEHCGLLLLF